MDVVDHRRHNPSYSFGAAAGAARACSPFSFFFPQKNVSSRLQDAIPPQLLPRWYQIGALVILVAFPGSLYVSRKLTTAEIYSEGPVPELKIAGFVVFSLYRTLERLLLTQVLLSLTILYRTLRYPRQGVLIEEAVPLSALRKISSSAKMGSIQAETEERTIPGVPFFT